VVILGILVFIAEKRPRTRILLVDVVIAGLESVADARLLLLLLLFAFVSHEQELSVVVLMPVRHEARARVPRAHGFLLLVRGCRGHEEAVGTLPCCLHHRLLGLQEWRRHRAPVWVCIGLLGREAALRCFVKSAASVVADVVYFREKQARRLAIVVLLLTLQELMLLRERLSSCRLSLIKAGIHSALDTARVGWEHVDLGVGRPRVLLGGNDHLFIHLGFRSLVLLLLLL